MASPETEQSILPEDPGIKGEVVPSVEADVIKERKDRVVVRSIVTIKEENYPPDVVQIIPEIDKKDKYLENSYYISNKSPLGDALMQRQEDDEVIVIVKHKGEESSFSVTILSINNKDVNTSKYFSNRS